MPFRRLFVVTALALSAAGCSGRGAIDTKAPIIIISIDTLRSDHLPAYGYAKVETPSIDAFRADAIRFDRAYSQCPLTLVSHASIFTGLLPAEHGIRDNLGYHLDAKAKTLAEMVKGKGYATGGAVSAVVLRGDSGIQRGFDFWDDNIDLDPNLLSIGRAQRDGEATRAIALQWIGAHKAQPFFFFFHIYEPHTPYEPPEPFRTRYGNTYDGEVAAADDIVGKFLNYLREEGIYDRATILLLSDHGEGLGDHGEDEHGVLLYRETLQVPLLLKLPHNGQKGSSVADPVELIDVMPTFAQAFGAPQKLAGRSLLDVAAGKVKEQRDLYAETYYPRFHFGWNDLHSIISGANHYIHGPKPELYDLVADTAERKNILNDNRRVSVALRDRIQPFIHTASAPAPVDDEQKQQLIALGYVGSTINTAANAVLPDPRENIGKANAISQAFRLFKDEKYEESLKVTNDLLHDNPRMLDIWALQSRTLAKLNRREEAVDAAKEGLKLDPRSTTLAVTVSNLSMELGRYDDAEQHAKLALEDSPNEAHRLLAQIAIERKDFAKARAEANAAMGENRDRPAAMMLLGRSAMAEGKLEEALGIFDQTLALLAKNKMHGLPQLNYFRGDTLARMGRGEEAEVAFLEEIRLFPRDPQAYKNLILLYAAEGKNREATQLIFSLEKESPTPPSYLAIAETLKIIGDVRGSRFWAARGLQRFPSDRQLAALLHG
jgi:arylsulfatase A-like enzyme/Flp pilus assembly protein TadD